MKRLALFLSIILGCLVGLLSAPTYFTATIEQGLQRFNGLPMTHENSVSQPLLQVNTRKPSHLHATHLYQFAQGHPLLLYIGENQPINFARYHAITGEQLTDLTGQAWANKLHALNYQWHSQWQRTYFLTGLSFLLLVGCYWISKPKAQQTAQLNVSAKDVLLIFASQTGTAETMAQHLTQEFYRLGRSVHCLQLNEVTPSLLQQCTQALFIVSTCGDGDPPDNGARFVQHYFHTQTNLSSLNFGVLALGDKRYHQFCAFGSQLYKWLINNQANAFFSLQTHDSTTTALPNTWLQYLQQQGITSSAPTTLWHTATLVKRTCLNPDNPYAPMYLLRFTVPAVTWQAGDILCCQIPTQNGILQREYSIANTTSDPYIELVVRSFHKENGSQGIGSGWLTQTLVMEESIAVSIRSNANFHPAPTQAPNILIGAGSGIAGLRSHWHHRAKQKAQDTWLIYGERHPNTENFLPTLLSSPADGAISTAFSQCEERPQYVQDILLNNKKRLSLWVHNGAYIYVCGSQEGMGEGVHQALLQIFGAKLIKQLIHNGRYRRDLY